jgi:hypothetical protein
MRWRVSCFLLQLLLKYGSTYWNQALSAPGAELLG